jgi:hypothetical protein
MEALILYFKWTYFDVLLGPVIARTCILYSVRHKGYRSSGNPLSFYRSVNQSQWWQNNIAMDIDEIGLGYVD